MYVCMYVCIGRVYELSFASELPIYIIYTYVCMYVCMYVCIGRVYELSFASELPSAAGLYM